MINKTINCHQLLLVSEGIVAKTCFLFQSCSYSRASSRDTSGCRMVPLVPEPEPGLLPDLVLAAGYRFWLEAVEQLRILDMDTCRHTIDQLATLLGIQVLLDMICSIGVKCMVVHCTHSKNTGSNENMRIMTLVSCPGGGRGGG